MTAAAAERLNRYLARRGIASRRAADALIAAGRVTVNGRRATVGSVVQGARDRVAVDGRPVPSPPPAVTLALHKPVGVVSTSRDPQGRPTVLDLVPRLPGLVAVGRLDADSSGLILLTTDGELAHRVAHPRHGVRKRYLVTLAGRAERAFLDRLTEGVQLEDGRARAVEVRPGPRHDQAEVVMEEGRKREVRRLCAAAGREVTALVRTQVGPVALGSLREGAHRPLSDDEDRDLRRQVGLLGAVVTVDGPAGSGKSTLGTRLAETLRLPFIDTGLLYRALTVAADRAGLGPTDGRALAALAGEVRIAIATEPHPRGPVATVDGEAVDARLHDPALAGLLAAVSAEPGVRAALLGPQRALARHGGVAVGRDCGTVVFPEAPVKFFLDAPEAVRLERRARQLARRGDRPAGGVLEAEVAGRDRADSTRSAAPLRRAPGAHVIDTARVGVDAMVAEALAVCAAAGIAPP